MYMITREYATMLRIDEETPRNGKVDRQVYFPFHTGRVAGDALSSVSCVRGESVPELYPIGEAWRALLPPQQSL
jgi:hypothetical protein